MNTKRRSIITGTAGLEQSINSLLGILEGIAIDGLINRDELAFLEEWSKTHAEVQHQHPFNELVPAVLGAIEDGAISEQEKSDLKWLCERLTAKEFYTVISSELQRLRALIDGIQADCIINTSELKGLSDWLDEHSHLRRCWPYEELVTIVTAVLADGKIEQAELNLLCDFLKDVTTFETSSKPEGNIGESTILLSGLCAVCPEVLFEGRNFCLSGKFTNYSSKDLTDKIIAAGGKVLSVVDETLDYLIIGSDGNPCWMYACYGRHVEEAIRFRRKGHQMLLVHENDLLDAFSNM